MTAALTHSEWNEKTGGNEAAEAFADRIKGRKGKVVNWCS